MLRTILMAHIQVKTSHVTFMYIALYTKHLNSNKQENDISQFFSYEKNTIPAVKQVLKNNSVIIQLDWKFFHKFCVCSHVILFIDRALTSPFIQKQQRRISPSLQKNVLVKIWWFSVSRSSSPLACSCTGPLSLAVCPTWLKLSRMEAKLTGPTQTMRTGHH